MKIEKKNKINTMGLKQGRERERRREKSIFIEFGVDFYRHLFGVAYLCSEYGMLHVK